MNGFRSAHLKSGGNGEAIHLGDSTASPAHAVLVRVNSFVAGTRTAAHADIALARDEASHFLPWIIALMVYLAALVLAGSFTLNHTVTAGHRARVQSFSVHIPHAADKDHENGEKALALIRAADGVEDAQIIGSKQIQQMVEPWFGKGDVLGSLPLPVVIDARLKEGASVNYENLRNKLQPIGPGVTIDDHKQWVEQFSSFIKAMQFTLVCIALLIIATTASIVIFACKTSLKIHRGTVNLLHRLGAFDSYIARQFQNYAGLLTLKGSFIGSGFASLTLLALHFMAHHIESPLFPAFSFSLAHWLILFTLPLLMSGLALVVVRFSVLKSLRKIP